MKKIQRLLELTPRQYGWGIVIILCLAAFLRFYKLAEVPHGMYWDEAAIGYNGYAIVTTRRDEWLTRLPVSFRSFGDYKAPLAIYLNGPFTYFLGMTLFAVRLPFALMGLLAVLGMIYLTRIMMEEAGESAGRARWLSLAGGMLITVSPWHHHFSRLGLEAGIALTCFIWGIYFFHKALAVTQPWRKYADCLLAALGFIASMYSYHSAKITVPLTVCWLLFWHRKRILRQWQSFTAAAAIGIILLRPMLMDAVYGSGLTRAGELIFSRGYSWGALAAVFFTQLAGHFSAGFLFFGETLTLRHGDGHWGVLLPTTGIALFFSLLLFWRKNRGRSAVFHFALFLIAAGLLPAALGTEVPHANRALLALPGFLLLAVLGIETLLTSRLPVLAKRSIIGTLILLHSFFFMSYLHDYYTRFAAESAADFQDGYLEAFQFALPYERGENGHRQVDKIIFTSDYGQPYIYALFVRRTNPIWYHGGSLVKYEFKDEITVGDLERENTLIVASGSDELLGENEHADHVIYGSDGSIRFRIYIRQ